MATFVWAAAATSNWSTGANWKVGGVAQGAPPTAADDVLFGSGTGATNSNCNVTAGSVCRSIDTTGYTGTLLSSGDLSVGDASGGAAIFGAGTVFLGSWGVTFVSTSNNGGAGWNIALNGGQGWRGLLDFNGAGGRWKFTTSQSSSAGNNVRVSNGTLDDNGQTVTTNRFIQVGGVALLSGTWTVTVAVVMAVINVTGGTFSAAAATFIISAATSNTRSLALLGGTLGTLTYTVAGSTGALQIIPGGGKITTINFSDVTNARIFQITSGDTLHYNTWNGSGSSGKVLTVNAITPGTRAALTKDVGPVTSLDFMAFTDIDALGGAVTPIVAGANSTVSNCVGVSKAHPGMSALVGP